MKKQITEQQNAPLGETTSASLPNCLTCEDFTLSFEIPYCNFFEMEVDISSPECIKRAEAMQNAYERVYLHHYMNKINNKE